MKYRKKKLLQMLFTLKQINQSIGKADSLEPGDGGELLAECQSVAIEIGTCLEDRGGQTAPVVTLLEDYCELLYQLSIHWDFPEICRQISGKIQDRLNRISGMIQDMLPEDRKEIVFLPYKASMWDSMESVWMAAEEDGTCSAYVVPIPYFERRPDRSLGQMFYEGNEYPDYVPVTDWREYSIPDRIPDVIYIHNPYDEYNYVTSVHPDFYAKELKRYTDKLVYIPYFVGINSQVKEHLCVMPGTIYADQVIVESEEIRRVYLDAFRAFEKNSRYRMGDSRLEKKFLALGSPKLDRVMGLKREAAAVPESWEYLMRKGDGTRKRVVFYNITIDSFLKNSGRAIEKAKRTLGIFKKNPEVILLWRPHPLLLSAIRSIRPDLYEPFFCVLKRYREEQWGIYDDTADVERAIAISDAYYGDWSSVVTLFQAAGKPVMIREYEREKGEEGKRNV